MPDPNDKNGKGDDDGKVTLTVGDEKVEKTLDELKEIATAALGKQDQTVTLKIDGEDKTFTSEELREAASKAAGADKKFDDASKMREKAESGLRIQELLGEMNEGTPSEAKMTEFMGLIGVNAADMKGLLDKAKPADKDKGKGKDDKDKKKISLDDLDERAKAALESAEQADLKQIRENIKSEAKKALDNDKVLGKIIDEASEEGEQRDKYKATLYDRLVRDIRGRILAREPYGPEMIQSSLQQLRAETQNLGIPAKTTGQPPLMGELGAAAALAPEIRANEPIKRVPSTDPSYGENAVQRFQQMQYKAARGMKTGKP